MSGPVPEVDAAQPDAESLIFTPRHTETGKPMFPMFAEYSKRLESFSKWPEYLSISKKDLAEAGLVCTGVADVARCYSCGGGHACWINNNIPMEEHARWFPECPHILQVKGKEFVKKMFCRKNQEIPLHKGTVTMKFEYEKEELELRNPSGHLKETHEDVLHKAGVSIASQSSPQRKKFSTSSFENYGQTPLHLAIEETGGLKDSSYLDPFLLRMFHMENRISARKKDEQLFNNKQGWAIKIINSLMNVINGTLETATEVMSMLVRKCPELFPNLDRTPTQKDLLSFAQAIGENFRYFGLALGVSDVSLDQISMDNPTVVMKTFEMLKKWCNENPLESSLSTLIQTLKTCGCVRVDWGLIGKLCM